MPLLASHHHPVNSQRRRGRRAAKFQVIANVTNVVENVFEIYRKRHFFHRIGKLTVFNPQRAYSAGEIAGDYVHAKAEKL